MNKLDMILQRSDEDLNSFLAEFKISPKDFRLNAHFSPHQVSEFLEIWTNPSAKMMHYTRSENVLNIAKSKSVWLRNSRQMKNDKYEMKYGMTSLIEFIETENSQKMWNVLDDFYKGISEKIKYYIYGHESTLLDNTYIFCVTKYNPISPIGTRDMWDYGDVAIIINPKPMGVMSDAVGAHSYPVLYAQKDALLKLLNKTANRIASNPEKLEGLSEEEIIGYIWAIVEQFVFASKDTYFHQEREWRIVYNPILSKNSRMKPLEITRNTIKQQIYSLPLEDIPEEILKDELLGLKISSLVYEVIIPRSEKSSQIKANLIQANKDYELGLSDEVFREIETPESFLKDL